MAAGAAGGGGGEYSRMSGGAGGASGSPTRAGGQGPVGVQALFRRPLAMTFGDFYEGHFLSDEQLGRLARNAVDRSFDLSLAAGGIAVGLLPSMARVVQGWYAGEALGGFDLAMAAACLITATAAAVLFWHSGSARRDQEAFVEEIRSRTQVVIYPSDIRQKTPQPRSER